MCKKVGGCTNSNTLIKRIVKRIDVQELFKGDRQVIITHDGHDYRLQITRNKKLILTK